MKMPCNPWLSFSTSRFLRRALHAAAPRVAEAALNAAGRPAARVRNLVLASLTLALSSSSLWADPADALPIKSSPPQRSVSAETELPQPTSHVAPKRPRFISKSPGANSAGTEPQATRPQWEAAPDAAFLLPSSAADHLTEGAAATGKRLPQSSRVQRVSAQAAPTRGKSSGNPGVATAHSRVVSAVSVDASGEAESLPPSDRVARYDDALQPKPLAPQEDANDIPRQIGKRRKPVDDIPEHPLEDMAYRSVVPLAAEEYVIDLNNALQLAEINNPRIALGREAIRLAMAAQLEARGMLLPTLNAGTMYHLHSGALQTSFGQVRTLNEQSIYFGGGSRTLAAETMAVPMVRIFANLGDAIFAPLAATRIVAVRNSDSTAIQNSMLLEVTARYMDLLAAETRLEAILQSETEIQQVVQATADFARTGLGRDGDYQRARSDALLMHTEEQRAQESVALTSANLARVLSLDPAIRLKTIATGSIEIVQLVDMDYDLDHLVNLALVARPEVAARGFDISAAHARVQQEKARPFLPLISVGYSAGGFGGGSNQQTLGVPSFYMATNARTDIDVWAIWTLQNMGIGNLALQKQRSIARDQAVTLRSQTINQIRKEVTEAYALTQARRQQVVLARQRMLPAVAGVREELERIRGGEGLPLETLNSVEMLAASRQDLISAIVGYDLAQFQLFVALGQTPGASSPEPKAAPQVPAP